MSMKNLRLNYASLFSLCVFRKESVSASLSLGRVPGLLQKSELSKFSF